MPSTRFWSGNSNTHICSHEYLTLPHNCYLLRLEHRHTVAASKLFPLSNASTKVVQRTRFQSCHRYILFSAACVCKSSFTAMPVSCGHVALLSMSISTELQMSMRTVASRGAMQDMTCRTMASSVWTCGCTPVGIRRSCGLSACRWCRLATNDEISCIMLLRVWSLVSLTTYSVRSLLSSGPKRLHTSHFFERLVATSVVWTTSSSFSILKCGTAVKRGHVRLYTTHNKILLLPTVVVRAQRGKIALPYEKKGCKRPSLMAATTVHASFLHRVQQRALLAVVWRHKVSCGVPCFNCFVSLHECTRRTKVR